VSLEALAEMRLPMTSIANTPPIPPAAERMRRYRERRHNGLRCVTVEILESEIDALVRKGLLGAEMDDDPIEIAGALYKLFEEILR
jgi:hypothetical protein